MEVFTALAISVAIVAGCIVALIAVAYAGALLLIAPFVPLKALIEKKFPKKPRVRKPKDIMVENAEMAYENGLY